MASEKIFAAYFMLIIVVATLGSCLVCTLIAKDRKTKLATRMFVVFSAFCDVPVVWVQGFRYWYNNYYRGAELRLGIQSAGGAGGGGGNNTPPLASALITCRLHSFFTYSMQSLHITAAILVSLDRCAVIGFATRQVRVAELFYRRSVWRVLACISLASALSFACSVPLALFANFRHVNAKPICDLLLSFKVVWRRYSAAVYLFIPFSMLLVCNVALVCVLRVYVRRTRLFEGQKQHAAANRNAMTNRDATTTTESTQNTKRQRAQERKSLNVGKTIVLINIIYIVFRMPIQIFADYVTYSTDLAFDYMKLYYSLAALSVTYNAASFFIYYATSKTFRQLFWFYVTCKCRGGRSGGSGGGGAACSGGGCGGGGAAGTDSELPRTFDQSRYTRNTTQTMDS